MKILHIGLDGTTIQFLKAQGITAVVAETDDIEELPQWIESSAYDALVLNLDTCDFSVYATRYLRTTKKIGVSIVGISRGKDVVWPEFRADFLEQGGDDLIRAPVNPRELAASLRAVTRRFKGALVDFMEFVSGEAVVNISPATMIVMVNDRSVRLTGKELVMLMVLASHPGRVVSKEHLLASMYAETPDIDAPELKIIDVFICKVRSALDEVHPDAGKIIQTVWGRGYMASSVAVSVQEKVA